MAGSWSSESLLKLVGSWIDEEEANHKEVSSTVMTTSASVQLLSPAPAELAEAAGTATHQFKCSTKSLVAERKRREKLNELLCALSSLVPNIKKMDKATIVENAVNYIKKLQSEVQKLEAQMPSANPVVADHRADHKSNVGSDLQIEVSHTTNHICLLRIEYSRRNFPRVTNALMALELDVVSATIVTLQDRRFGMYIVKKEDWDGLSTDQIRQLISEQL